MRGWNEKRNQEIFSGAIGRMAIILLKRHVEPFRVQVNQISPGGRYVQIYYSLGDLRWEKISEIADVEVLSEKENTYI